MTPRARVVAAGIGFVCAAVIGCALARSGSVAPPGAPAVAAKVPKRCGSLDTRLLPESSGLVRSRRHAGVFWTHNDSGNQPRIFAVRKDGSPVGSGDGRTHPGILVAGAVNGDWEDIAVDGQGRLILADLGNNQNRRRDLALYLVPEPDPRTDHQTEPALRIAVHYPEQKDFPGRERNFDGEAVFCVEDRIYVLTKHRSDRRTRLYRLAASAADPGPNASNPLVLLGDYPIGGMVTAADGSADGGQMAVLTYGAVWVFERPDGDENYLAGRARWLPLRAGQCEAICFDDEVLVVGNEAGDLFEIPLADLIPLAE